MARPTKEVSKYSRGISKTEVLNDDASSEALLAFEYFPLLAFSLWIRSILDFWQGSECAFAVHVQKS